jgi:hypothetical protein
VGRVVIVPTIGDYAILFNRLFFCPVQCSRRVRVMSFAISRTDCGMVRLSCVLSLI